MWYAGIDWAMDHHDTLVIDEKGRQVGSLRIAHTPQGMNQLNTFLEQIIGTASKEEMACIIETTHGLLIAHLLEALFPVYPVNPRTVDHRRSASGAKTDLIDAYLLAKTGRADLADLHRLTPDSETVAELKLLTRDQEALIQMQTRLVNQLTACRKRVLSSGSGVVLQAPAAHDAAVSANLSNAFCGDGSFGRADHPGAQERRPSQSIACGTQDR